MADSTTTPGITDIAADSFAAAQRTVESASDLVDETSRHFKKMINAGGTSKSFPAFLEVRTRAAPLTMLGLAFVAGLIIFRRS